MEQQLSGIIHGNTIVLDMPLSLPDGERVEVIVREASSSRSASESASMIDETPPAWWTTADDRILEEIYQARKRGT